MTHFNPRSREGSDRPVAHLFSISGISIHAPAKGATLWIARYYRGYHFNPRSREGSDSPMQYVYKPTGQFQSTLPRRERPPLLTKRSRWAHFNPRSREGSDGIMQEIAEDLAISIHAPAKGATLHCFLVHPAGMISIHAPAKGATAFINIFSLAVRLFFISSHQ